MEKKYSTEFEFVEDASDFFLISDFDEIYQHFSLRQSASTQKTGIIRERMVNALKNAVDVLHVQPVAQISNKLAKHINEDYFVITLDGGIIYDRYDFSIEISRACSDISKAVSGPYLRLSRQSSPLLMGQILLLLKKYEEIGRGRPCLICDDGIGSGGTMRSIVNLLKDNSLEVNKIVVVTNPKGFSEIEEVPVVFLPEFPQSASWLNERDLFWGLPRSGMSVLPKKGSFRTVAGIPYISNERMIESRIGIPKHASSLFLESALKINIMFFEWLEHQRHRQIHLSDCPRLQALSFSEHKLNDRVIDIMNKLIHEPPYRENLFSESGALLDVRDTHY